MSNHEAYREWLALAAAGALEEREERELHAHAAGCAECAAALQSLRAVTGALARIPTPQPRPEIVERAQALAAWELAATAEKRQRRNVLVLVMATAWLVTLSSGVLLQAVCGLFGTPAGLGTILAILMVATWSATGAILCANDAKARLMGRQA